MALIYPAGTSSGSFTSGVTNSGWASDAYLYGAHFSLPSAGTVSQLGVYAGWGAWGSTVSVKLGLYTSGGVLVGQTTASASSGTVSWRNSPGVSFSVTSAGTYFVLASASNEHIAYGYSNTFAGSFATEAYATAMAATESITDQGDASLGYGVRLDFTAGGGGSIKRWVPQMQGGMRSLSGGMQ